MNRLSVIHIISIFLFNGISSGQQDTKCDSGSFKMTNGNCLSLLENPKGSPRKCSSGSLPTSTDDWNRKIDFYFEKCGSNCTTNILLPLSCDIDDSLWTPLMENQVKPGLACKNQGCFIDSADARDMEIQVQNIVEDAVTENFCISQCRSYSDINNGYGYKFASTQRTDSGFACFCGNSFGKYGIADNCNFVCKSDNSNCGGINSNFVTWTNSSAKNCNWKPGQPSNSNDVFSFSSKKDNLKLSSASITSLKSFVCLYGNGTYEYYAERVYFFNAKKRCGKHSSTLARNDDSTNSKILKVVGDEDFWLGNTKYLCYDRFTSKILVESNWIYWKREMKFDFSKDVVTYSSEKEWKFLDDDKYYVPCEIVTPTTTDTSVTTRVFIDTTAITTQVNQNNSADSIIVIQEKVPIAYIVVIAVLCVLIFGLSIFLIIECHKGRKQTRRIRFLMSISAEAEVMKDVKLKREKSNLEEN